MATSTIDDRPHTSVLVASIATVATASVLFLSSPVPSKQYSLDGMQGIYEYHRWSPATGAIPYEVNVPMDTIEILHAFGAKLLEATETLDPKIAGIINRNFSKLF